MIVYQGARGISEEPRKRKQGPLGPNQGRSARRKREVVLRLLRGEPLEAVSRELGVGVCRCVAGPHCCVARRGQNPAADNLRGCWEMRRQEGFPRLPGRHDEERAGVVGPRTHEQGNSETGEEVGDGPRERESGERTVA